MKTSELLNSLLDVAPALAVNDIVPINSYVRFTGETLMAYNGKLAISVPLVTDFVCAAPRTIIDMVKACKAKSVELTHKKDELQIRGASTKMDFVTKGKVHFNYDMPQAPTSPMPVDAAAFVAAVEVCLRASSNDTTRSDYLGVTVAPDADGVIMYGASESRMARACVAFKKKHFDRRVILSSDFCKHLLVLAHGAKSLRMVIDDERDAAVFTTKDGKIMAGNLGVVDKPIPFADVFKRVHSDVDAKRLVQVPSKFMSILERACIVTASDAATIRTSIEIKDGVAHFTTVSRYSKCTDRMQVPTHPDVIFEVDAREIRAVIEHFNKMLITDKAIVLASRVAHHCISGRG